MRQRKRAAAAKEERDRRAEDNAIAVAILSERQRQAVSRGGARYMLPWWIGASTDEMMSGEVRRRAHVTAYPSKRRQHGKGSAEHAFRGES